jgi:hypothetical protein
VLAPGLPGKEQPRKCLPCPVKSWSGPLIENYRLRGAARLVVFAAAGMQLQSDSCAAPIRSARTMMKAGTGLERRRSVTRHTGRSRLLPFRLGFRAPIGPSDDGLCRLVPRSWLAMRVAIHRPHDDVDGRPPRHKQRPRRTRAHSRAKAGVEPRPA